MTYVDGFLIAIAPEKLDLYKEQAEGGRKIWMEHGALDYKECLADDLISDMRSFRDAADVKGNETVIFSFITFKSREHRDEVNAKVMGDKRLSELCKEIPFEPKRMCYGGFKTIVEN